MKKGSMVHSTVTFMSWHTYLLVRDTWNSDISGCPGFYATRKTCYRYLRG